MKKIVAGLIAGLCAGVVGMWLLLPSSSPGKEEEAGEGGKSEHSRLVRGTNGATFVKLDEDARHKVGLQTAALEPAELSPELRAVGRVLDAAALALNLSDIATAQASLKASTQESERIKILFAQNQNASARAVETAQANLARDQIAWQAARQRLLATWGSQLARRADLEAVSARLLAQESALVRVDVAAAEPREGRLLGARLALLADPDHWFEADWIGPAPSADPQTLSPGHLCLVNGRALPVNTALLARLRREGPAEKGVLVPRGAVLRHEGEAFVYVQSGEDLFERQAVELDHPLQEGWFSTALKPGTRVVVTGAQQLLSEEFKGEGGGE